MAGNSFHEAFVDPIPCLQWAADRRVTDRLLMLGKIIAEEIDGPALFNRAEMAGTVDEEVLDLCGNALACCSGAPGVGRFVEPCQTRGAIRLEPGAHGVLVAVSILRNVGDAPTLSIE